MSKKPVLVAGKNGQLARCLGDLAKQRDMQMVSIGRPELDLELGESIDRVVAAINPSAIINAAAYTGVDRAEAEPARAFAVNCDGALRLALAAGRRKIPFVHISTDYVFDGSKPSPYCEEDNPAPLNVYGASKLAAEVAVLNATPCVAVLRTSWVYSPYGNNFVRSMQRLAETQPIVRVVDDQHGTPTSATDLANAVLMIVGRLQNSCSDAGIYHLAGEGKTSWHGFAAAIFASLARRGRRVPMLRAVTTAEYPTPALRPRNSCLDSSKAEGTFGVKLSHWQFALEACLDQLEMPEDARTC